MKDDSKKPRNASSSSHIKNGSPAPNHAAQEDFPLIPESKYREIIENIHDLVYIIDAQGNIKYFNSPFERATGYRRHELVGRHFSEVITAESLERVMKLFKRQLRGEDVGIFEVSGFTKDKRLITIETRERFVWDNDRIVEVYGIGRNVTERNRVVDNIMRAGTEWERTFDAVPDLIAIIDKDHRFVRVNRPMAMRLGTEAEKVVGSRCYETIHGTNTPPAYCPHSLMLADGAGKTVEIEEPLLNSSFLVTASPLYNEEGKLFGSVHVLRDITEQRRTEETLRFTQFSIDNSGVPTLWVDQDARYINVNTAACEMLGYSCEELTAMTVFDIDPTMTIDKWKNGWRTKRNQANITIESYYRKKDGNNFPIELNVSRFKYQGKVVYLVYITDISERKRLEQRLVSAQKMEAVGLLAGGIAHDYNNILTAIMGYTSLLKRKIRDNRAALDNLSIIEQGALRASELTKQLLTFSRKGGFSTAPLNLSPIIRDAYSFISKTFDKSIHLEYEESPDPLIVMGDQSQIHQIVMNLAINARDAMPNGGRLTLRSDSMVIDRKTKKDGFTIVPGRYARITMRDSGVGMSPETLDRIYEPYFTTKKDQGGTGLGMSVVYGIVKGHEGHIDIISKKNEGTEVQVYLPLSYSSDDADRPITMAAYGGTETIFIVDDEPNIIDLFKSIFAESGYTVITAESGKAALKIYKKRISAIDLVLLDLIMPNMGGRAVLKKILAINPHAKVLIASGLANEQQNNELILLGAKGFIGKPFTPEELLKKTRQVLEAGRE